MESEANCRNGHIAPLPLPTALSNINLKLEIFDDLCRNNPSSSRGYVQNFPNLYQSPFATSSFNLGTGIQTNIINPIGSFGLRSSTNFDLYELDEENGSTSVHNLQGCGFLNFLGREDSLMEVETALEHYDSKPSCFFNSNETSCVTANDLGRFEENGSERSKNSIKSTVGKSFSTINCGRGRTKSKSAKGQWTAEEDRLLIHLVEKYGVRKWSNIAQMLKGRIGKQCRERWHNHLRPDIKKDIWTEEEDRILIEVHAKVGNKWAEIAKRLPGRTENTIKNHWNATKRRQFTKRKCRTKWPNPSPLLQNYIKSLIFQKEDLSKSNDIQPPPATDSVIVHNSSISEKKKIEIEFSPDGYMVPEYDFDELAFDDDCLFKWSNLGSFVDDIPIDPSPRFDEELCFNIELPFDMPEWMQCEGKKEFDFFDGSA